MATTLDEYDFRHRGPIPKYPWREWLDGRIWKIVKGKDYEISTQQMRNSVAGAAARQGKAIRTEVVDDGKAIVFQAIPKPLGSADLGGK